MGSRRLCSRKALLIGHHCHVVYVTLSHHFSCMCWVFCFVLFCFLHRVLLHHPEWPTSCFCLVSLGVMGVSCHTRLSCRNFTLSSIITNVTRQLERLHSHSLKKELHSICVPLHVCVCTKARGQLFF